MRILIVYATTQGHTRRLARFLADRLIEARHSVRVYDAADPHAPGPRGFDFVLLAGSLHVHRFQHALVAYARRNHNALGATPNAMVAVSLAAADAQDDGGLAACMARFERETQWRPDGLHHAAGALAYSAYGWLTRYVIKSIAASHGRPVDTSRDYDLTDYDALARFVSAAVERAVRAAPAVA